MKNFAYGYTDREIGSRRPTSSRPAPPLLYHKPQTLSIGILHKNWGEVLPSPNLDEMAVKRSPQGQPHLMTKTQSCKKSAHTSKSSSSTPLKASHSFTGEQPSISDIRHRPKSPSPLLSLWQK